MRTVPLIQDAVASLHTTVPGAACCRASSTLDVSPMTAVASAGASPSGPTMLSVVCSPRHTARGTGPRSGADGAQGELEKRPDSRAYLHRRIGIRPQWRCEGHAV